MAYLKDVIYKPITGEWGIEGNGVSVLRTTNFTNAGVLNLSNVIKRDISDKKIVQKKLIKGDIIIEKSGGSPNQPVGRVVFFEENGVYLCNNFTSILRPKKDIVDPKYLHYLLFAGHKFGVTELFQNKTTGIINLQLSRYIEKIKIPLPPLTTQKRIAEILDNAAALLDKTKQLLEKYDQLTQSIFFEMFGDPRLNVKNFPQVNLGEILEIITYGLTVRPKYINKGVRLISARELKSGKLNLLVAPQISESDFKKLSSKGKPKKGEILFSKTGSIGHCVIIDTEEEFAITQNAARLSFKENINPIFALEQLRSSYFQTLCQQRAKGNAVKDLQLGDMKKLPFIVPPIHIQNEFAKKLALIEKQKKLAKQELKESEDLFQTFLQKAFKGDLVNEEKYEMKVN